MTNITTLKNKYYILLILTGINIVIFFTSIRIDNQLEWKVWNIVTTCYTLDKICQWLTTGLWFFSIGIPVSSTNKIAKMVEKYHLYIRIWF